MGKFILIVLAAGAMVPAMCPGGISLTNQSRDVSIQGRVPGAGPTSSFNGTDEAQPGDPFDQSLENSLGTGEVTANAAAKQNSSIELTTDALTFSATGSVVGASSDPASYFSSSSRFSFTFVLDAPATYLFSEKVASGNESDLGLLGADLLSGRQSLFGAQIPGLPRLNALDVPSFQTTGSLLPGTFTFTGGTAGNGNLTAVDASYTVNFKVSALPQAIPLPAGIWLGTVGLILFGFAACQFRQPGKQ